MNPLLLLGLATVLAGCDLFGDCSFESAPTREQRVEAAVVASVPESVVVAFVETDLFSPVYGPLVHHDAQFTVGADSVRVRGFLTTRKTSPDLAARLDVRGDTVFVSLDAPLVRLACSPPLAPGEGSLQIELPRGVVVRASVVVQTGPARASTAPAPASRPTLYV